MDFEKGTQVWQEVEVKPLDCRRLQAGMFIDRPDLWRKPKRKPHQVAPEQMTLIQVSANQSLTEPMND
jgi:hypothetical protein